MAFIRTHITQYSVATAFGAKTFMSASFLGDARVADRESAS